MDDAIVTTPNHYLRDNLRRILGKDKYILYHWTSTICATNILREGFIQSKGMLFGLNYPNNPQILKQLKHQDLLADSQNGFIDYVVALKYSQARHI